MTPEVILLAITSAFGAVVGVAKALNNFNEKMQLKFNELEDKIDRVEDDMVHDYVLKQDFIREMNGLNQKLDRIWEYMVRDTN
ncbi:MAG: hypothetical protein JRE18_06000 [Deltaproteobacteria bacterium]|jgi:hypothetical protein|nr:hypothetical protein [Deltaproteobacteria bacterium]